MNIPKQRIREVSVLSIVLCFISSFVIWVRTATVRDTYLYVQHEKEFRKYQQELQAVRVQWLKLTSPHRLDSVALSLGLKPPKLHQILKYEPPSQGPVALTP